MKGDFSSLEAESGPLLEREVGGGERGALGSHVLGDLG